jgi:hypothetical protein
VNSRVSVIFRLEERSVVDFIDVLRIRLMHSRLSLAGYLLVVATQVL